jgi:hypothetical protein
VKFFDALGLVALLRPGDGRASSRKSLNFNSTGGTLFHCTASGLIANIPALISGLNPVKGELQETAPAHEPESGRP